MPDIRQFKVVGSSSDLKAIRELIRSEFSNELIAEDQTHHYLDDDLRQPLGMEPLTYFLVAFAAHVAADGTHDLVKLLLERIKFFKKDVKIK